MAPLDTNAGAIAALGNPNGLPPAPVTDPNAAPAIGPAAAATTPALIGGMNQLGNGPEAPVSGGMIPPASAMDTGVAASLPSQLNAARMGSQASKLMASAPNPNAPMAWAKAWMGSAMGVLSGLGDADTTAVKPGGGWLEGVTGTMANRNERLAKQKEQQQQQAHQQFEEQREMSRDQREAHDAAVLNAHTQQLTIANQKAASRLDEEDTQKHIAAGKLEADAYKAHHKEIKEDHPITEADIRAGGTGPGQKYDVAKVHFMPTGMTKMEKNGKLVDEPTFSVFANDADPVNVNKEQATFLNKYLGMSLPTDAETPMDGDLFDNAMTRAMAAQTTTNLINKQARQDNISELDDKKKMQTMGDRETVSHLLGDHPDDAITALGDIAKLRDQQGAPTKEAEAAQRLLSGWDPKELETHRHNIAMEQEKKFEAASKNSNNKDLATGNTNLTGDAYLASIPNKGQAALVKSIGEGFVEPDRMEYLIARNPGIMQDISLAYGSKGLDTTKFHGYLQAVKDFTTGSKIANQLNSANTSLVHLKALYDDNNVTGAFIPGTVPYARRQADLNDASMELARFLTGGTAPSNSDIEGARKSLDPSILSFNAHDSRQAAVKEQTDRINEKIDEYKNQWHDALPNPQWTRPMPGHSPQADAATAYIQNDGKLSAAPATGTQQAQPVKPGPLTFKQGQIFMQNGHPFKVTSVDADGHITGAEYSGQ